MHARIRYSSLVCLLCGTASLWGQDGARAPDFTREVRPLLARFCFKCHGPDEKTRKAKLRLDLPPKAASDAIVPGNPDASALVARVYAADPEMVMPPPSTKMALSAAQKAVLKRWIAAG